MGKVTRKRNGADFIGLALHAGLSSWIRHYNTQRPHSALAARTPDEVYRHIGSPSQRHVDFEQIIAGKRRVEDQEALDRE